jgi:hypothetical protein
MTKNLTQFAVALICLVFFSCSNKGGTSAVDIARKWCDLNGKVARAADGPDKEAAKAARKEYEREMDAKYAKDSAMTRQIGDEVEKCENASEGK